MDDTDRQLVSLLRDNARLPVAALAKMLRVARGTVQNRLARMEKEGTIVGYTVKLKPQAEDQRIRALMTVAVEGNRTDEVLKRLRGDPCVASGTSSAQRIELRQQNRRHGPTQRTLEDPALAQARDTGILAFATPDQFERHRQVEGPALADGPGRVAAIGVVRFGQHGQQDRLAEL